MQISKKEYLMMQPGYPEESESDEFYYKLAEKLGKAIDKTSFVKHFGENIAQDVVLGVVGYFQDIIADAGIFRSFCTINKELYGRLLPFYETDDEYIESELNYVDVCFMVWYITESSIEDNGTLSPFDPIFEEVARPFFKILDSYYDAAPVPVDYNMLEDFDLYDNEQIEKIYDFSYWLFWNSYFMRHAAAPTMRQSLEEGHQIILKHPNPEDARPLLLELNQRTMQENPTGPLSLYVREWLRAIVENKSPFMAEHNNKTAEHKYYTQFIKATKGNPMKIFDTYESLNDFLTNDMGWGKADKDGHLPQIKDMDNFVLYVTREKGMLVAVNIAQYIGLEGNVLYNIEEARKDAHSLVTVPGRCPIDLVCYLFSEGMIPDARFAWDESGRMLLDNWDFCARLYLQSFYRAK